ncbi:MAG: nicotinate-nucleotide--dimethylbenzimidazole phosphoribosyltransferase [Desulfobacteraceae bacterium]|jgi:nicotinate-nucleotide--dimethylbenzimidazole phosphoribosyltransferase
MDWRETANRIQPLSREWLETAWSRLDDLTKPRRSLGLLEDMAARYTAIREETTPRITGKAVYVFVGDHGVVAEGVSAYPQEVTTHMVRNFLAGGAGINVLARAAGAEVHVVDIGMAQGLPDAPGLIQRSVRRGTGNLLHETAMTLEEAETAIGVGVEMAHAAHAHGVSVVATGDMGIGNTTPSSALFAALLPAAPEDVTGRGTGLNDAGLAHKVEVITNALKHHDIKAKEPLFTLAAVGGLEMAAICGLCLGGAALRLAVLVDGFISSAGALAAMRLNPAVTDYLYFSHCSVEKGHRVFFKNEGLRPILDLDLRLGEGTGAAVAMQILEDSVRIYNEMATFADAGIQPGA